MKSLQDYIEIYRGIARNLNLQGDSVEMIAQMLANASYISEVENISYAQESSLERATLINSKIQHCMNEMYSVFRGSCPRVIIRFKATKYFSFNIFDEISSSNNFKIYYLGYYGDAETKVSQGMKAVAGEDTKGFIYSPTIIQPSETDDDVYTIIGLLAKERVDKSWTLNSSNTYYVNCTENDLSSDLYVKVGDSFRDVTRVFADHILNGDIFDLTLPSFGMRLYTPDIFRETFDRKATETPANTVISASIYKYSTLDSYNASELKQIKIKGAVLKTFPNEFLTKYGYSEISSGVITVPEVERDSVSTIHYQANRDRYVNSIIRSNADIGTVLEETYPEKIRKGGTTYEFRSSSSDIPELTIYYIPQATTNLLTEAEITSFSSSRAAYYITNEINILKGRMYKANLNIRLEIYQNDDMSKDISDIMSKYENKFGINLDDKKEEMKSLLSKVSNIKQVTSLDVIYTNENGEVISREEIYGNKFSYFNISYTINSSIYTE